MLADLESDFSSFINPNDKGSDSIVFQIGSHSVKFGFASQLTPFIIPTVIAYRKTLDEDGMEIDLEDYSQIPELSDAFLSSLLNIEQETLKKQMKLEQKLKNNRKIIPVTNKSIIKSSQENNENEIPERKNYQQEPLASTSFKKAHAMSFDLNEDILENNYKWTSTEDRPSFLVGREAQTIFDIENYILRHPIKYGFFNPELTYQQVLDDLSKIIRFCVSEIMKIEIKNFNNFNIVLIIPDVFVKQQVKGMVNVFLRDLNFKSIFLHTESVMSSFGAAMQSSCVVDIGASKISVCCVDEGHILEESVIRKNYGGDDITSLIFMMMSRKNNNSTLNNLMNRLNMKNPYHFRIIEKMKETECEFPSVTNPSSCFIPKSLKIWMHRKTQTTKVYNLTMSEQIYVPPLTLLNPEIFESFRNVTIPFLDFFNDIYAEHFTDSEDVMDDLIKNLVLEKKEEKEGEKGERGGLLSSINLSGNQLTSSVKKSKQLEDEDSLSVSPSRSDENSSQICDVKYQGKKNTWENMFKIVALDELICQSIMSVENTEMRKRLANCILLVGGSAKFKGFIDYLEDILIDKLTLLDPEIERLEIINFPNVDLKTLTWIGGTIIPKLESSKDMWITKEKWSFEIEKFEESKEVKEMIKDSNSNINFNDNESKSEIINKEKQTKKKEKHINGGINIIREKSPFQW
jgi:actin-related protein 8